MQMPVFSRLSAYAVTVGALLASAGAALAELGQPAPWQLGLQQPASPVMADITSFHNFLLWIIGAITLFVLILLLIVMVRFNARANPTPSRTTHNALIESSGRSFRSSSWWRSRSHRSGCCSSSSTRRKPDLTVKATGKQWYWSYDYPDNGNFEFNSLMVADKDLKPGQPRLSPSTMKWSCR